MALTSDVVPEFTPPDVVRKVHHGDNLSIEYAIWQPAAKTHHCTIALHGFSRPLEDMLGIRPLLEENTAVLMPHLPAHGLITGASSSSAAAEWSPSEGPWRESVSMCSLLPSCCVVGAPPSTRSSSMRVQYLHPGHCFSKSL